MAYVKGKSGYVDIAGANGFTARVYWSETYVLNYGKSKISIDKILIQSATFGGLFYPSGSLSIDGTVVREMHYTSPATHSVYLNAGTSWWEVSPIGSANAFPWVSGEIEHDADGSKVTVISLDVLMWRSDIGEINGIKGSATINLTDIPRASTATVPNFTMGQKKTISITRASDTFTHNLTVKLGGQSYQIATNVKTSYAWTPDVDTWASRVLNAASAKCTMVVDTYNGSTLVGSNEYSFTLSVPSTVVPTISAFATEMVNENAVVNGWGIAVKGFTKVKWAITADGASGSTISKYAFAAGSVTGSASNGTSAALNMAGEITPTATVTDSRGRTATATDAAITVEDYKAPRISIAKAERCDEDGTINHSGACVKLTFTGEIASVAGKNTASYQNRFKPANGSYSEWAEFESGAIITGFATTMSYVIEMRVVDALGKSISTELTITTREEWLHGKEGGKGAAFGKAAEEDNLLDVAWNLRVRGNLILDNPLEDATGVTVVTEAGTNLNDYKTTGWYFFPSADYTPTNVPAGVNGWLQVIKPAGSSWVKQIWYRAGTPGTNDHQTYVRTHATSWGAWKQYYATNIADLVAMNLNDITDTDFYVNANDDLNNYLTPGAYRISASDVSASLTNRPPYSSAGGRLIVSATSSSGGKIQVIIFNSTYGQIWYRIRSNSGTWGDWFSLPIRASSYAGCKYTISSDGYNEWYNPPMVLGTEYRTTERWNNQVVYTKLVNCGTLTNGGTYTYHDSTVYPIRYAARTSAGIALPLFMEPALNSTYKAWVDVNTNKITARFASGYSSLQIYCQIWYTK